MNIVKKAVFCKHFIPGKIMNGKQRRSKIKRILAAAKKPVSGDALAAACGVSRQIIVRDIALMRADNSGIILATNRGYLLMPGERQLPSRTYFVNHENDQIEDELNTIVDQGGTVLNVMVDHEIYGQVTAPLVIRSRRDVQEFVEKVRSTSAVPLKYLGNGRHYHTVQAETEEVLDAIQQALAEKGYLINR